MCLSAEARWTRLRHLRPRVPFDDSVGLLSTGTCPSFRPWWGRGRRSGVEERPWNGVFTRGSSANMILLVQCGRRFAEIVLLNNRNCGLPGPRR